MAYEQNPFENNEQENVEQEQDVFRYHRSFVIPARLAASRAEPTMPTSARRRK